MSEEMQEIEKVPAKAANVIIVMERRGADYVTDRRYVGDDWSMDDNGALIVLNGTADGQETLLARYAPGAWLSVRRDGTEAPDGTARALSAAKRALKQISQVPADEISDKVRQVAEEALNDIFAETEL